jgi:hypothetical protein
LLYGDDIVRLQRDDATPTTRRSAADDPPF